MLDTTVVPAHSGCVKLLIVSSLLFPSFVDCCFCRAFAVHSVGHQRHYVFKLSISLCMHAAAFSDQFAVKLDSVDPEVILLPGPL